MDECQPPNEQRAPEMRGEKESACMCACVCELGGGVVKERKKLRREEE
jgi:hypothetical protein